MAEVAAARLRIGLEVHVELAARSKVFSRAPNPAAAGAPADAPPNTLTDPVVLGAPGALPVPNRRAVELSIMVGLALGCAIATRTRWDRKSYFYPDLPKGYQISQADEPVCGAGVFELPPDPESDPDGPPTPVRIMRAHLEEDAGKLMHEGPGGRAIGCSIVDYNRAGAPLLEIVTAPDFTSADQCVRFAQLLRSVCRFVGATEGVMQRGHMRFEPNVNMDLELAGGRRVTTPIVEVKNLNSFRALRGAIEYERREQPRRFLEDGVEHAPGRKTTRGWDDRREVAFLQREKEEAHDYRYHPDPDLPPVEIDPAWVERLRAELPEPPHARAARYRRDYGLGAKAAAALVDERASCEFFEACAREAASLMDEPAPAPRSGRAAANVILQAGFKLANERGVGVAALGVSPAQVAQVVGLREAEAIGSSGVEPLLAALCASDADARSTADRLGLLQVRDEGRLEAWCREVLDDPANVKSVADLRSGKQAAIGRLIGGVMQRSGGRADAKAARAKLLELLG